MNINKLSLGRRSRVLQVADFNNKKVKFEFKPVVKKIWHWLWPIALFVGAYVFFLLGWMEYCGFKGWVK